MVNFQRKTGGQFAAENPLKGTPFLVVNLQRNQVVNLSGFSNHTCQLNILPATETNGLTTAVKNKYSVDDHDYWLFTVFYYDDHNRLVREFTENHLNGHDYTDIKYDWNGLPLLSDYYHSGTINNNANQLVMHWSYSYDKSGRLTEIGHRMDNNQEFSVQKNKYNEIGQLIERNFHSADRIHWLQSVDYKYNILGWLTNINQANLTNNNSIIDLHQALDPDETVNGLIYDSIFLLITEKQYEGNLYKYLNLEYQDRKKLLVSDIDTPSQTRFIQINEMKSKILDKKITDTLTYNFLAQLHDIPFAFDLNGLEFDAYGSQAFVLDSLKNEILNKLLSQYQVTDTNLHEYFLKEVVDFIGSSIGIIYVNDDRDDIFGENIYYNCDNSSYELGTLEGTSRFNGNISNILWQTTGNPGIRGYGFQYDRANRFTQAKYAELDEDDLWTINVGRYDEYGIDYDENGNILHLNRNGLTGRNGENSTFGNMDQLTYTYNGNQLKAVQDYITNSGTDNNDFKDNGTYETEEYTYDYNGSMISDGNKGIASIMYNYLNLPVEIVFSDDQKINYLYDASGRKLRMTITYADRTVETFNYCGGVIYHDQDLESIEFGVGRVVKKPDSHFYYQYYMTDHLGNIRQVYEYNESTQEVEVVQENHFYPYGLTMGGLNIYSGIESTHLYQGKELENKTRLNWYDFHARRFDSQLGRWHALDPVLQFASPYVGMGNNPVIGVDPDGTSWEFHGHQHFQQGYVNGEKVGDPIPGEIDGYWYWNDYPTFTSSGNFTIHPGNSGHAGSGGNGGGNSSNNGYHYIGGPDGDEEQNIQKPNIPELINDIYKLLNGIINSLVSHVELDNCETAARIADIVPDAIGFWVGGSFVAGHGASQQIGLVYVENYGWAIIGNTSGGFGWDVSLSGEMQLGWSDNPDISTYEGINWSTSGNVNAPPLGGLGLTASYFSDYNHFNQTFGQNWKGVSFGVSISPPIFNAPLSGQTSIGYTYVILRITKKP